MGKTKIKYPVKILIQFILPLMGQTYVQKGIRLVVNSSMITFQHIKQPYEQFLQQNGINYPTIIQWLDSDVKQQINEQFRVQTTTILDQCGGKFTILVQSYMQELCDQITIDIEDIRHQVQSIKQRLNDFVTRQEIYQLVNTLPQLQHKPSSSDTVIMEDKQLDLGVLFSEPVFDQIRKKPTANPVDFRSEIQRLHTALKSSMKAQINLKCQIATKQNLKHLIKYSKPKILHIICHGTSEGQLQFQDDSRTVLGTLQLLKAEQIVQTLKNFKQFLPEVVFINSCYSERVGQMFFKLGVNYVISIDSEDTIQDQAAQIFSEHFYRNIFSGEKVRQAFKQAREKVKMEHNAFGCCCRHSSKQVHKPKCRWLEMIRKIPNSDIIDEQQKLQKHKLFHVPWDLCKCQLKNLNRHRMTCEWAKQALFHINNDFRIPDGNGGFRFPKNKTQFPPYLPKDELVICCCFNYQGDKQTGQYRLPHSQSNKFKIMQNPCLKKRQSVFQISSSFKLPYKQLSDYTSPQLVSNHDKIQSSIMGRQRQIYQFMKRIKDSNQGIYIVFGSIGVGRTSFVLKCVTYLIQRRVFQLYFYIDLYGVKDMDIFRYKFNEVTKFNYDGQVRVREVKGKMMVVILDNADDFFEIQKDQLYEQLKNLRQQLHKTKIILTLKEQNCRLFDFQRVQSQKFGLEPLSIPVATKLIFSKMRHLFDVTVQYNQIDSLVRTNQSLRIPKIIQSVCQSFSSARNKIKMPQLKNKIQSIFEGDLGVNQLIQENIVILKQRSQSSYNLLLFMSQFSEGISIDDFKMLSIYDKKDSRIHLPIKKDWQASFFTLFEKITLEQASKQGAQSQTHIDQPQPGVTRPRYKRIHSQQADDFNIAQCLRVIKGQSYFLDQVSTNKFMVKRFIRDFIWKKHQSPENYHMKYIFVGYMAVTLEIYFRWLVNSKYIHQDLLDYSSLSQAGLFGFRNNVFNTSMGKAESVRIANYYNLEFQRIVTQHPTVAGKNQKSDPSIFIANHKQDFLNIYEKRWDVVLQHLKNKNTMEDKICIGYLQSLLLFIPTAFKIAKVQSSLLKYVISKSMNLLVRLQKYSQDKKYPQDQNILTIQLKLQLMKATVDIQKSEIENIKNELGFNKQFTMKLVKSINQSAVLQQLRKYQNFEKTYVLMYKQYSDRKQSNIRIFLDKGKIPYDKLKTMIEKTFQWLNQNWQDSQQILMAKRNLIIGLTYLNILKNTYGTITIVANAVKLKKQYQRAILKMLQNCSAIFKAKGLMKLCLRAKLTFIEINTMQINLKKRAKNQPTANQNNQPYQQLILSQNQVLQCEMMYIDRRNNMIGFVQFENEIKSLKKFLKQKIWKESSNTLVCMRSFPLTINGKIPIIQNLARKKNRFRKQIEEMVNPEIDLCSKFQILSRSKLKQQVQTGCTMLLLSANVKICNQKPYLIFEGTRMQQDLAEINQSFVEQFNMSKIKILMIAGNNSYQAIRQLSKIMKDPPVMVSLGNSPSNHTFDQFQESYLNEHINTHNAQFLMIQERRKTQISFLKQFVSRLMNTEINSKQEILEICHQCENIVKNVLDLKVQYLKRKSSIQIHHKKGSYKDLSPGYQKNHNIDMKGKSSDKSNLICLRRWIQTYKILQYICKTTGQLKNNESQQKDQTKSNLDFSFYINVFGDIGSGKTVFIQQLARIFVQRQKYSSGVYIVHGKLLERKYQGEFQSYFNKQSEIGKIITLEEFQRNGDENLLLIIDDFHIIKPRSNGRFNLFLQKIVEKNVNLIIVTNTLYQRDFSKQSKKDPTFAFKKIKPIKIDRLHKFQIDIIAYNTLDLTNSKLLQRYEQLKRTKDEQLRVQDIFQLKNTFSSKKNPHEFSIQEAIQIKKIQSYQE